MISFMAVAVDRRVNRSMTVSIYLKPLLEGKGPTMSQCNFSNLPEGKAKIPNGDLLLRVTFPF